MICHNCYNKSFSLPKAAGEVLIEGIEWQADAANWLPDTDTILAADWEVIAPDGDGAPITIPTSSIIGTQTVARIEGGTAGKRYIAKCTVTTSAGEIGVRSIAITVSA